MNYDYWFDSWPAKVRGICEADSFAQHALWCQTASDAVSECRMRLVDGSFESDTKLGPGRVSWQQRNPGRLITLDGKGFSTAVSLSVNEIEGHLVVFWYCTSVRCDWQLAKERVSAMFPNTLCPNGHHAVSDAMNFHNLVAGLRSINAAKMVTSLRDQEG